jgi:hypothetical protein
MRASVVSSKPATLAAFCNAERVTLVGSIMPACAAHDLEDVIPHLRVRLHLTHGLLAGHDLFSTHDGTQ